MIALAALPPLAFAVVYAAWWWRRASAPVPAPERSPEAIGASMAEALAAGADSVEHAEHDLRLLLARGADGIHVHVDGFDFATVATPGDAAREAAYWVRLTRGTR